jgi:hypothetical protein
MPADAAVPRRLAARATTAKVRVWLLALCGEVKADRHQDSPNGAGRRKRAGATRPASTSS